MSSRVCVVGALHRDLVVRAARFPQPGETVLGEDFALFIGGKGANQAVAAARAGGRVTLVARVGDDVFGERAVRNFEADGIDVRFVLRDGRAPSGVALINVGRDGENSISVASGANALLSPEDIRKAEKAFDGADVLLLQLETPPAAVRAAVQAAASRGLPVILNPAPARPLDDGLLAMVSVLTPNETEAEILAGTKTGAPEDVRAAAAALRARGPRLVVVTLGERGCYAAGEDFEGFVPAFPVRPVDTTAAGDVFSGVLAVALAEKRPLVDALRFASAAAALSVTKPGAQPSAPARGEIEAFLAGRP